MEQLRHYNGPLVAAFDRDEAGVKGLRTFLRMAYKNKIQNCFFVFPPKGIKDWNELYIKRGKDSVLTYLMYKEELDYVTIDLIEQDIIEQ